MKKVLLLIIFCLGNAHGQSTESIDLTSFLEEVREVDLTDISWQYTHLLHYESNTILHKADEKYKSYLFFKYDYSVSTNHQGKTVKNEWCLDNRTIKFEYRKISEFKIIKLDESNLVLEYQNTLSQSTFQYHFIKNIKDKNLFNQPTNELPIVHVKRKNPKPWWAFWRKVKNNKEEEKKKPVYINIELVGGGYYGGINPVVLDYIKINTKGRLIMEHKTRRGEHTIIKKDISRKDLEAFGNWIFRQGYFEAERAYECTDGNCQTRKKNKPKPIPLRLVIAYGKRKKMVTIDIWGKDHLNQKYIEYPAFLDNIIDAIQRMAHT